MNVSILENVLYGNQLARNSEVKHACEVANCYEFISNKQFSKYDETPTSLMKAMEDNKDALVSLITQEKYDQEMEILQALKAESKEA